MLIDKENTFSWDQAITSDAISTNVIDLLATSGAVGAGSSGGPSANTIKDIGAGRPLYLHAVVTTQFTTGDSGTLTVTVESDDNTSLSSATVHDTVASAVAAATLAPGYWIAKGVPLKPGDYQRYLGLRYTTNTGDFTGGKVSAWISDQRFDDRTYQSGYTTGVN